jgi:hypothetical protein
MKNVYMFVNSIELVDKFCTVQVCNSNYTDGLFSTAVIKCCIYMEWKCIPDYVPYQLNDKCKQVITFFTKMIIAHWYLCCYWPVEYCYRPIIIQDAQEQLRNTVL